MASIRVRPSDVVKTGTVQLDAKTAERYLETMGPNRNLRRNDVKAWARAILTGNWKQTHQGLAFNKAGTLIDGQHRCQGVILADAVKPGISIPIMVTIGLGDDTREAIDIGVKRLLSDELNIQRYTNSKTRVAWMRRLCLLLFGNATKVISINDYREWEQQFGDAIEWGLATFASEKKMKPSAAAAALLLAYLEHPDAVVKIVAKVRGEIAIKKGDPGYALDQYLTKYMDQPRGARKDLAFADYDNISKFTLTCCLAQAEGKGVANKFTDSPKAYEFYKAKALQNKNIQRLAEDVLAITTEKPKKKKRKAS